MPKCKARFKLRNIDDLKGLFTKLAQVRLSTNTEASILRDGTHVIDVGDNDIRAKFLFITNNYSHTKRAFSVGLEVRTTLSG